MIQPIEKIKSLLSNDIVTLFSKEVLNVAYINAYKIVNSLITDDACLDSLYDSNLETGKYVSSHTSSVNSEAPWYRENFNRNRRILLVERKNEIGDVALDNDGLFHKCIKLKSTGIQQATNPKSIYYENDKYSPKYYHETGGQIIILPHDVVLEADVFPRGRIFWLTYPDFNFSDSELYFTFDLAGKNFSEITLDQEEILFYGIPIGAKELLYIEMALNLLHNYMADFVYSEEDTELVGLLKEHAVSLLSKKNEELNYVLPKYGNMKAKK